MIRAQDGDSRREMQAADRAGRKVAPSRKVAAARKLAAG
jgi:hypothetical protein